MNKETFDDVFLGYNFDDEVLWLERERECGNALMQDIEHLEAEELSKYLTSLGARQARRGGEQVFDMIRGA